MQRNKKQHRKRVQGIHELPPPGLFKAGLDGNQHRKRVQGVLELPPQAVKAYGINADMAKAITAKAQQEYYANNH